MRKRNNHTWEGSFRHDLVADSKPAPCMANYGLLPTSEYKLLHLMTALNLNLVWLASNTSNTEFGADPNLTTVEKQGIN